MCRRRHRRDRGLWMCVLFVRLMLELKEKWRVPSEWSIVALIRS